MDSSSNEKKTRVAIYTRVSTVWQAEGGDSLPMQRKELTAYAELILHAETYKVYEDAGFSGKNMDRPEFQKMMADVRNGLYTHILVWKIDRISRNLLDFASMYAELKKLGVVFVSKNEQFDTSSAMGEAMLKIILVFAELERNMTVERVRSTMDSRARAGLYNGGRAPLGYSIDLSSGSYEIVPDEADIVRDIYRLYVEDGFSIVEIAEKLNRSGVRTKLGREFDTFQVQYILKNSNYTGSYRYTHHPGKALPDDKNGVILPEHHEAIVSKSVFQRAQKIMAEANGTTKSRVVHTHAFTGLLFCAACGRVMTPHGRPGEGGGMETYMAYRCIGVFEGHNPSIPRYAYRTTNLRIGPFIINLVLHILNAARHPESLASLDAYESHLLSGMTFETVEIADGPGIHDLYRMAVDGHAPDFYAKKVPHSAAEKSSPGKDTDAKLKRAQRALERLKRLYLYSDDSMTEAEYLAQRDALESEISDLRSKYEEETGRVGQSVSDDDFINAAGRFILQKNLQEKNFIDYKRLCREVPASELNVFFKSILSRVVITTDGLPTEVVFKNGIILAFKRKNGAGDEAAPNV